MEKVSSGDEENGPDFQVDNSQNNSSANVRATKRAFTLPFKLNVIKCAERHSNHYSAQMHNVGRTVIIQWRKDKDKIEAAILGENGQKRKRIDGGGKKLISNEMEQELSEYIVQQRAQGLAVSRSAIQREARRLFPTCDDVISPDFKASSGWLNKFMLRNNFSLRRRTSVAQKDPDQLYERIVSFIGYTSSLRSKFKILDGDITAMDETAVFMDMPSGTTVDTKGVKTVTVKTTGHEKDHFTCVLSARGDGTKLKPYIIFKGAKREVKSMENLPNAYVVSNAKGWMEDNTTKDWVNKVLVGSTFSSNDRTQLLVWDSARPHISKSTKAHLVELKLKSSVVPGGCTKYIQAPDVSWNRPFKAFVENEYKLWMEKPENMSFTKSNNLKPPPRKLVVEWIINAWETVTTDVIVNSFKTCALTIDPSGADDDQIHCLKEGQPCRGAWEMLQAVREDRTETEITPFVDDNENDDLFCIDFSDEE